MITKDKKYKIIIHYNILIRKYFWNFRILKCNKQRGNLINGFIWLGFCILSHQN